MDTAIVMDALNNATMNQNVPADLIIQTDLGSQYTSKEFEGELIKLGIKHSYSRKGTPYDNSCIESFHASLKKEEVYHTTYQTFEDGRLALFEYIESWYNRNRIHSSINYMTPQEAEDYAKSVA
jgi:transposase InsO family protein